jgi:hypothetical protein
MIVKVFNMGRLIITIEQMEVVAGVGQIIGFIIKLILFQHPGTVPNHV